MKVFSGQFSFLWFPSTLGLPFLSLSLSLSLFFKERVATRRFSIESATGFFYFDGHGRVNIDRRAPLLALDKRCWLVWFFFTHTHTHTHTHTRAHTPCHVSHSSHFLRSTSRSSPFFTFFFWNWVSMVTDWWTRYWFLGFFLPTWPDFFSFWVGIGAA